MMLCYENRYLTRRTAIWYIYMSMKYVVLTHVVEPHTWLENKIPFGVGSMNKDGSVISHLFQFPFRGSIRSPLSH